MTTARIIGRINVVKNIRCFIVKATPLTPTTAELDNIFNSLNGFINYTPPIRGGFFLDKIVLLLTISSC
jgi:hypothetical protein